MDVYYANADGQWDTSAQSASLQLFAKCIEPPIKSRCTAHTGNMFDNYCRYPRERRNSEPLTSCVEQTREVSAGLGRKTTRFRNTKLATKPSTQYRLF